MKEDGPHNFVVLSSQRSGSTWLIDVLNNLHGVKTYGELFLKQPRIWDVGAVDRPRFFESPQYQDGRRPSSISAYLDALYAQPEAVGFKLMYAQLRKYPEIAFYLRKKHTRALHLVRRNHLDVILSNELKRVQGLPHLLKDRAVVGSSDGDVAVSTQAPVADDPPQVILNAASLRWRLRWLDWRIRFVRVWLRWMGVACLEVAYEDLAADPLHFEPVWAFLKFRQPEAPRSQMVKIRKGTHKEVIGNYEEVRAALSETPFYALLDT